MSSPYVVRKAEVTDAEAFAACQLACWQEAYSDLWTAERFDSYHLDQMADIRRTEIESGTGDHYVAESDGSIFGIASAGPTQDTDTSVERELYAIYVRKAHQGSGVSTELLEAVIGNGPATLWVYRDNSRASAFYINRGFIPDGAERVDPSGLLEIRFSRR